MAVQPSGQRDGLGDDGPGCLAAVVAPRAVAAHAAHTHSEPLAQQEYFDAYLIGLTATPAKHTFGFFHQNLVMEYPHERAVADGVNVDFEVYRIRTRITGEGSVVEASDLPVLGLRDRRTRSVRWEAPDEPLAYRRTSRGLVWTCRT